MLLLAGKLIAAGTATVSILGSAIGLGLLFLGFLQAMAQNPSLREDLFSYVIFAFALIEAIALFGLMMAFIILFGF
jgi:F-type H+-transporting ATPase subunit c